jgi:hypothetical protein
MSIENLQDLKARIEAARAEGLLTVAVDPESPQGAAVYSVLRLYDAKVLTREDLAEQITALLAPG